MRARLLKAARGALVPIALLTAWEALSRGGAAGAYAFVPLRKMARPCTRRC